MRAAFGLPAREDGEIKEDSSPEEGEEVPVGGEQADNGWEILTWISEV